MKGRDFMSREMVMDILAKLPEHFETRDFLNELYIHLSIINGLEDIESGETYSTEELLKEIEKW